MHRKVKQSRRGKKCHVPWTTTLPEKGFFAYGENFARLVVWKGLNQECCTSGGGSTAGSLFVKQCDW
ncbi:hypothetical protein DAI22_05g108300 [Oryza sativa Japonica Group]|nr:hypothetical protein DAI22_05g108300 [Oryza sativa Japonica Group]